MKLGANDQIKYYKAHLVTKKFSQIKSVDFNKTYSSIIGYLIVWTLFSLICANS